MHHILSLTFHLTCFLKFTLLHVSVVCSFLYIIMDWVLNKDLDREKEIGSTGKGNSLGQRLETQGMVSSLLWM